MNPLPILPGQLIAAPGVVPGKFEVEFKLGNLSHAELQLCASFKALLCDERFDALRRRLAKGGNIELTGNGTVLVAVPKEVLPGNPALN